MHPPSHLDHATACAFNELLLADGLSQLSDAALRRVLQSIPDARLQRSLPKPLPRCEGAG